MLKIINNEINPGYKIAWIIPVLNSKLNCRDHRKNVVIDGKVEYTRDINLADEYINKKEMFVHWKDNSVMLKGNAVWNLTVIFLTTWNYIYGVVMNILNLNQFI